MGLLCQKRNSKASSDSILDSTIVSTVCLVVDGIDLWPFVLDITSGGRSRQPPYKRMRKNLHTYIDPEHLPGKNFKIKDPRSMERDAILAFFTHISQRQRTYDLQDVFRIKHAHKGRKRSVSELSERESDLDGRMSLSATEPGTNIPFGIIEPPQPPAKRRKTTKTAPRLAKTGVAVGAAHQSDPAAQPHPKPKGKKKRSETTVTVNIPGAALMNTASAAAVGGVEVSAPDRPLPKPKPKGKKNANVPPPTLPTNEANVADRPVLHADSGAAVGVVDASAAERPCPKPKPKGKKNKTAPPTLPANEGNIADRPVNHADSAPAVGAVVASAVERPRPKPKPKGKKNATVPPHTLPINEGNIADRPVVGNHADSAAAVGALYPSVPEAATQISMTHKNIVSDDLIDPALSGVVGTSSHHTSGRPQVNTADNLALIEASKYMVTGKRVPKKRG
jgi:hypothetical protein